MSTAQTDHLLSTTRAVRRRLDLQRPVERSAILECLQLAIQAPTASNMQSWRWLVIDDPDIRADVAELFASGTAPRIERRREHTNDPQTRRIYDSALYLTTILSRVPVLIVPCVDGRLDGPRALDPAVFYGSIFPAIWSLQLALRSRGLGSVMTTPFLGDQEALYMKVLRIPPAVTPIALLPVAYTIGDEFKPAKRPPVETVTWWNRWSE